MESAPINVMHSWLMLSASDLGAHKNESAEMKVIFSAQSNSTNQE